MHILFLFLLVIFSHFSHIQATTTTYHDSFAALQEAGGQYVRIDQKNTVYIYPKPFPYTPILLPAALAASIGGFAYTITREKNNNSIFHQMAGLTISTLGTISCMSLLKPILLSEPIIIIGKEHLFFVQENIKISKSSIRKIKSDVFTITTIQTNQLGTFETQASFPLLCIDVELSKKHIKHFEFNTKEGELNTPIDASFLTDFLNKWLHQT